MKYGSISDIIFISLPFFVFVCETGLEPATPVGLKAVAHTTPDALPLSYPQNSAT